MKEGENMEQVINRYQSPYRTGSRKIEIDKKAVKFWGRFVKQTIISAGILSSVIACENVDAIANSEFWNKATMFAKSDINIEQVRNGLEWGIEYVKVAVPEILNSDEKVGQENVQEAISNDVIEVEESSEPEVDPTEGMTQEEKDIYNIVKATTILRPLNGEITSRFGDRVDPITKKYTLHTGTDFAAVVGTQVKSAITGTVIEVKESNVSLGNHVKVKNADIVTTYAHCSEIKVKEGDKVSQGDVIALSGNTGKSSGPHLHFEVLKDGRYVNPENVIYVPEETV